MRSVEPPEREHGSEKDREWNRLLDEIGQPEERHKQHDIERRPFMIRRSSGQLDEVGKQDDGRQDQHHRKEPEQEVATDIGGERDRKPHRLCLLPLSPVSSIEVDQAGDDEKIPPVELTQSIMVPMRILNPSNGIRG